MKTEKIAVEKLNAFDYQTQKWVQGEAAKALLISQIREEIELLESPEGENFLKMGQKKTEVTITLCDAIKFAKAALANVQGAI